MARLVAAALASWLLTASVRAEQEVAAALVHDDECSASASDGRDCSLSAVQLRGVPQAPPVETPPADGAPEALSPATAWSDHHHHHHHHHNDYHQQQQKQQASTCQCCHHEEKITEIWKSCAAPENQHCGSCSLYEATKSHRRCGASVSIVGDKVCPRAPVGGSESVTQLNAANFASLWRCAAKSTHYSPGYALIVNPWLARTMHQLHVKTMPLDERGHKLVERLEKSTDCRPGKWHHAHFKCPYSWARLYPSMPSVFSEVMKLATSKRAFGSLKSNPKGQLTLATVGVTVLFICNGKPLVLAHGDGRGGCSIEHSIYGGNR